MKNIQSESQRRAMFANMSNENKFSYTPVYAVGDIGAMGVDAVGSAGSVIVGAAPLLVGLGVGYLAADAILKSKETLEDKYKSEKKAKHPKSYSQRLIEKEKTHSKKTRYSRRPVENLGYYEW